MKQFVGPKKQFIAVSYSWEPMDGFENDASQGYAIKDRSGEVTRRSSTRDAVLDRVVRYARHVRCPLFWTAQDCVEQSDAKAKQVAMDSMDLVYSTSQFPLGLLSTILNKEQNLSLLKMLLDGCLVDTDAPDDNELSEECDAETVASMIALLEQLRSDRWWNRQWDFQEEYLGATGMELLIPHSPDLESLKRELFTRDAAGVNAIEGETCLSPTHLRHEATLFLHAVLQCDTWAELHERCVLLLDTFGKYNVLYEIDESHNGKAMSAQVFAELVRRDASEKYDLLPIAANSCDYAMRFDSMVMSARKYNLNICALMMYLLNGEIIIDKFPDAAEPFTTIAQYLNHISFAEFDPPVDRKQLTWLKRCRLQPPAVGPTLTEQGIRTRGCLWTVRYILSTASLWPLEARSHSGQKKQGLKDSERRHLLKLAQAIRITRQPGSTLLARKLEKYISEDSKADQLPKEKWSAKEYQDSMARAVVEAIRAREDLYLAGLEGSKDLEAIFVRVQRQDARVFTSYSHGGEVDGRNRIRHVSLQVGVASRMRASRAPPVVSFVGSGNGLLFYG